MSGREAERLVAGLSGRTTRMRRTRLADGRYFIFYDFEREPEILQPGPASAPTPGVGELRLSEQTGEWVITAAHRQERTHLPPPEYCPLCPSPSGAPPTEVPARDYEIAVFENRFPSLWRDPPLATVAELGWMVRPARGRAEVVLYTSDHNAVFGALSPQHIARLIEVWGQRYLELAAEEDVEYVSIFENRGEEIGVTLHHPHGQICAYPFVPPIPALEMATAARYRAQTGCCIHCDLVGRERKDGRRVVLERGGVVAFVPFAARWPYEVHVYVTRHAPHMAALAAGEVTDLAGVLRGVVAAYDALFDRPMPYVMAMHQAPTRGRSAETADAHYHVEFYPARRARDRLKFRAGGETGMGVFVNDVMPEAAAEMLRGVL